MVADYCPDPQDKNQKQTQKFNVFALPHTLYKYGTKNILSHLKRFILCYLKMATDIIL